MSCLQAEGTSLPEKMIPSARDQVPQARDQVPPAKDQVQPARDQVLPARDQITPARVRSHRPGIRSNRRGIRSCQPGIRWVFQIAYCEETHQWMALAVDELWVSLPDWSGFMMTFIAHRYIHVFQGSKCVYSHTNMCMESQICVHGFTNICTESHKYELG